MARIKPTVGRVMHYWPHVSDRGDSLYCEWMPYQQAVAKGDIPAVKHA